MTDKFTNVKAINAPKLIKEEINSKLGAMASKETTPTKMTLKTGVRNLGWTYPNAFLGSTPFRPITYKSLDTLACEASPEATVAAKAPARKISLKSVPPTNNPISGNVSSVTLKLETSGNKAWAK